MDPLDTARPSDLPPRTWRGWWFARPKWFRIGFWAALSMVVLHVTLAIRIAIGVIEAEEITSLRRFESQILYVWEKPVKIVINPKYLEWIRWLKAGLHGRSCANVKEIWLMDRMDFDRPIATDRELEFIAQHFPNLQSLIVMNADITAEGLTKLRSCRHLEKKNLTLTDIDDHAVEQLVDFPRLAELNLMVTRVTDDVIPILRRMKALKTVYVGSTDVTLAAIKDWKASAGPEAPAIDTDRRQQLPELLRVSVRWSDGTEDNNFATSNRDSADCTLVFDGPLNHELKETRKRSMGFRSLSQMSLTSGYLGPGFSDGTYEMTLQLVGISSEPMTIEIRRDSKTTQRLQFVMPVTKAEALEKWRLDRATAAK